MWVFFHQMMYMKNVFGTTDHDIHCSCSITCQKWGHLKNSLADRKKKQVNCVNQYCLCFLYWQMDVADKCLWSLGTISYRSSWLPLGFKLHVMLLLCMLGTIHSCAYIHVHAATNLKQYRLYCVDAHASADLQHVNAWIW